MNKKSIISLVIITVLLTISCGRSMETKLGIEKGEMRVDLTGDYLGQPVPAGEPELFAPGLVSDGADNRDVAWAPGGEEMYFTSMLGNISVIMFSKRENGYWSVPEIASFSSNTAYRNLEPCMATDGMKLYFVSNRPINDSSKAKDFNIWQVNRQADGWGKPEALPAVINTALGEYFPSVTSSGRMYFTRENEEGQEFIYRSSQSEGKWTEPEKLPANVNCGKARFNASVSPDEDFVIIPALGMKNSLGGVDYYIVFRSEDDRWSKPVNLGETVNTKGSREWSASVSPDGKYLFFMSTRQTEPEKRPQRITASELKKMQSMPKNGRSDIYWIEAGIIDDLREKVVW